MKNALKMLLTYFLFLTIGCVVGIVIVVEFLATATLIAGRNSTLFTSGLVTRAFFVAAPILIVYSGMFLSLYAVRHHAKKVIAAVTYLVLCVITWGAVLPAFLTFANSVATLNGADSIDELVKQNEEPLTAGYFRKNGKFIYFSTSEISAPHTQTRDGILDFLDDAPLDSVVLHTDDISPDTMLRQVSGGSEILKTQASPFTDILIRDTMTFELLPIFYTAFDFFITNANKALGAGILKWILFASFGVALCSVYAFIGISQWRIINTLSVVFATAAITVCNYIYYTDIFSGIRQISSSLGGVFSHSAETILVIANFAVAFIFIATGLIISLVRSAREKN